ncbi:MAG: hypothetical protein KIG84_01280 [Bacteroidales bacterium]|nr:hypothetical protein [Bacteroidales bacterium]
MGDNMNFTIFITIFLFVTIGLTLYRIDLYEKKTRKNPEPKFSVGSRVTFNDIQPDEDDFVGHVVRAELRGYRILYTIEDERTKEFTLSFEEYIDRADILYSDLSGTKNWKEDLPIRKENS